MRDVRNLKLLHSSSRSGTKAIEIGFLEQGYPLMIYKLESRLLPARETHETSSSGYLKEDFATWRRAALSEATVRMPADHDNQFGCECFQRLCGPGVCDLANDVLLKEVNMDQRVLTVIALMKHNPRQPLPLSRLAQYVNLSTGRLWYLFKAETGSPPGRYLKTLRMQHATTLLSDTFLSVKEIISRVGFSDESHFVKDFKRIYGVTPTEYRRQNLVIDVNKLAPTNGRNNRPRDSNNRQ